MVPHLTPGGPWYHLRWHSLYWVELFFPHLRRAETLACRISRCHYNPIRINSLRCHHLPYQHRDCCWNIHHFFTLPLRARVHICQACTAWAGTVSLEASALDYIHRDQLDMVLPPLPLINVHQTPQPLIVFTSHPFTHSSFSTQFLNISTSWDWRVYKYNEPEYR